MQLLLPTHELLGARLDALKIGEVKFEEVEVAVRDRIRLLQLLDRGVGLDGVAAGDVDGGV
jgi:hypothetical protein